MSIKIMKIIRFIPIISFFGSFFTIARWYPDSKEILKLFGMMLLCFPVYYAVSLLGLVIPKGIAGGIAGIAAIWAIGFAWGTYAVKEMEKASKR